MSVNCHACATVNRDGAKCCKGCGTALMPPPAAAAPTTACPACSAPCKPGARFCGQCGATLQAPQPAVAEVAAVAALAPPPQPPVPSPQSPQGPQRLPSPRLLWPRQRQSYPRPHHQTSPCWNWTWTSTWTMAHQTPMPTPGQRRWSLQRLRAKRKWTCCWMFRWRQRPPPHRKPLRNLRPHPQPQRPPQRLRLSQSLPPLRPPWRSKCLRWRQQLWLRWQQRLPWPALRLRLARRRSPLRCLCLRPPCRPQLPHQRPPHALRLLPRPGRCLRSPWPLLPPAVP